MNISNYSIPVYHFVTRGENKYVPEQVASASVGKFKNEFFIMTAGHVLNFKKSGSSEFWRN